MSAKRLPYLPFYVADWLSDLHVRAMSAEGRGAYIDLLALSWQDGPLPGDPKVLARMTGASEATIKREVMPRFKAQADGTLRHTKIERIRAEQTTAAGERSRHAADAAKARWEHERSIAAGMRGALPGHSPDPCPAMPSEAEAEIPKPRTLEPPLPPPRSAGGTGGVDLSQTNGTPGPLRASPGAASRRVRTPRRCHRCVDGRRADGRCCGCPTGRRRADAYRREKSDEREHIEIKREGRLTRWSAGMPAALKAKLATIGNGATAPKDGRTGA